IANYPSPDLPAAADWLHEIDLLAVGQLSYADVRAGGERVIANYPSPDLPAAADWLHEIDLLAVGQLSYADVR
ncbi:hypothetical protein CQA16_25485, partial [Enterobacter hormaechei]